MLNTSKVHKIVLINTISKIIPRERFGLAKFIGFSFNEWTMLHPKCYAYFKYRNYSQNNLYHV